MTPIHKLINTADRNLNKKGPKTARQNESKQKANFDPKAENLKAMMTKQKILNAPKQGKFRELANIYAKAIRSLVKVMYRASATQDAGALNVSRVYDFVQQVKEAIGTNYVTGGVDPEKCDCDEVFAIVFSREKDIGQKWKRCAEQPKTGDEIFSDYLCNILKTGRNELTEQETRDLKVFIHSGKGHVSVDLKSSDFIKVVNDNP
jgi:hypothetical protein